MDECRSLTVEKRREKLLLEKLREKKYAWFREEAGRTEQKELDESGIQGFFGRGASGGKGSFWE